MLLAARKRQSVDPFPQPIPKFCHPSAACLVPRTQHRNIAWLSVVPNLAAISDPRLELRCQTSPGRFASDVRALLIYAGFDPNAYPNWNEDMRALADMFCTLANGRDLKARLETTGDDACRRYHVHGLHLRMLCTYRGAGRQWLAGAQVDRAKREST